jgi:hypothetical protein
MFTNLIYIIILILGFPAGLILAKMCKDEIKQWRKRLVIMSIICLILALAVSFLSYSIFEYKLPVIIALFFMIITCLTIVWKSHKKR